jgi:hypothetical protein
MSSSLVAPSALAVLSTVLLSGTAMSRTEPSSAPTALPSITVQAPKPVARSQRPQQRAVTRNTVSRTVSRGTSPTAGEESVLEKLRRIERSVSSCDGGCQASLPSGDAPGSDAPRLPGPWGPQRAKMGAITKATSSVRKPVISSLGNPWKSGGIAPAWPLTSRENCASSRDEPKEHLPLTVEEEVSPCLTERGTAKLGGSWPCRCRYHASKTHIR